MGAPPTVVKAIVDVLLLSMFTSISPVLERDSHSKAEDFDRVTSSFKQTRNREGICE